MEDFFSGVYLILNSVNGKMYVGSSSDLERRVADHLRMLRGNYHNNIHLQNAWNKYGESNFEFHLLERCEPDKCIEREQWWIDYLDVYKTGYNRAPTAGTTLGIKMSDEVKARMSERMTGVSMDDATKEKIRAALIGKEKSVEHKNNIWKNRKGWRHSEESKKKTSDTLRKRIDNGEIVVGWRKGEKHTDETKKKMSVAGKGKPKSAEHKAKIAAALKGKKRSAEHCENISKGKRGLL